MECNFNQRHLPHLQQPEAAESVEWFKVRSFLINSSATLHISILELIRKTIDAADHFYRKSWKSIQALIKTFGPLKQYQYLVCYTFGMQGAFPDKIHGWAYWKLLPGHGENMLHVEIQSVTYILKVLLTRLYKTYRMKFFSPPFFPWLPHWKSLWRLDVDNPKVKISYLSVCKRYHLIMNFIIPWGKY